MVSERSLDVSAPGDDRLDVAQDSKDDDPLDSSNNNRPELKEGDSNNIADRGQAGTGARTTNAGSGGGDNGGGDAYIEDPELNAAVCAAFLFMCQGQPLE
jgi:hypothetical protein